MFSTLIITSLTWSWSQVSVVRNESSFSTVHNFSSFNSGFKHLIHRQVSQVSELGRQILTGMLRVNVDKEHCISDPAKNFLWRVWIVDNPYLTGAAWSPSNCNVLTDGETRETSSRVIKFQTAFCRAVSLSLNDKRIDKFIPTSCWKRRLNPEWSLSLSTCLLFFLAWGDKLPLATNLFFERAGVDVFSDFFLRNFFSSSNLPIVLL